MKCKLSIILPGIRTKNWRKFYNSVMDSFSDSFEIIIVSPYDLPDDLKSLDNIKIIKDYGSPSRCQQIGLVHCEGEFVTWGADDGWFLNNSLDEALGFWANNATSDKDIVTCKYTEGSNYSPDMLQDFYYKINHADGLRSVFVPNDYWVLNVGILKTDYAKQIGGWDSIFEITTISHMDFAVRTQRDGAKYFMMEHPIFVCDHMPGTMGDHGPVHYAHIEHAEPLFRKIYNSSSSLERVKIDLNNWEDTPSIWKRRF
jgi:hypothetical protein